MRFVVEPTTLKNFKSLLKVLDKFNFHWFPHERPFERIYYFTELDIGLKEVLRRDKYLVLYMDYKELRYTSDISNEKTVILDVVMKDYFKQKCIILNGGDV